MGDLPQYNKAESLSICLPENKKKNPDGHALVLTASVSEQQKLPVSAQ